jgi:hypothetical protein
MECRIAWIIWNLTGELSRLLGDLYEEDFEGFMEAEAHARHQPRRKYPMDVTF